MDQKKNLISKKGQREPLETIEIEREQQKKSNKFERKGTINKNVTVVYTDCIEEVFEAIQITEKGIVIGRMYDNEFFPYGFIPKKNIKSLKNRNILRKKIHTIEIIETNLHNLISYAELPFKKILLNLKKIEKNLWLFEYHFG